jgi:hypothetical protein
VRATPLHFNGNNDVVSVYLPRFFTKDGRLSREGVPPADFIAYHYAAMAIAKQLAKEALQVGRGFPLGDYVDYVTHIGDLVAIFTWESIMVFDVLFRQGVEEGSWTWAARNCGIELTSLRQLSFAPRAASGQKRRDRADSASSSESFICRL